MKKLLTIILTSLLSLSLAGCSTNSNNKSNTETSASKKIGIIKLVDHTSLNTIYDAIIEELIADGYAEEDIEYQNANGDPTVVNTITDIFKGKGKDVVIAITTPVAQISMQMANETPIIFAAVSDPVGAGLVSDLNNPDKNTTGTSDEVQVELIMDLAKQFKEYTTVGYIYNPSEINSVTNLEKLTAYANKNNIEIIESPIATSSDVKQATEVLAGKVDIIFVPNDNTAASAMDVISNVAIANNIPVFTGADSMVQDGGLATMGINYSELGKETARMADAVLKGTSVADIPVKVFKDDLLICVNTTTLAKLGLQMPEDLENIVEFE